MAKVPFPPNSTVIGLEGEVTALKYMQAAEGLGTNATPVAADDPQRRREVLAQAVAAGSPAYLTRELEGIAEEYSFSGDGPLVHVWPRGAAQAGEAQNPLDVPMDEGRLVLKGYDLQRLDWAGGRRCAPICIGGLRSSCHGCSRSRCACLMRQGIHSYTPMAHPLRWTSTPSARLRLLLRGYRVRLYVMYTPSTCRRGCSHSRSRCR